ncbi:MAG: long-chain fatty acid--CoA ligase, partial [Comamonas sp.]
MDPLWLQNYPAGVPHDVDPGAYRSVAQLIEESLKKNADQPFSVCMDRWMHYRDLDLLSQRLGAWLQGLGLEPG